MSADFLLGVAAHVLRHGGVIAYPTEGVWGLGCDPFNYLAVSHLLDIKQRREEKGLILVAANPDQLSPYLTDLSEQQQAPLFEHQQQATTWLIPHNGFAPGWIVGNHDSLAVRVSHHPVVKALCERFGGPIVSTSANISGRATARSQLHVQRIFAGQLDYVLTGALGNNPGPSRIRVLTTGEIIR